MYIGRGNDAISNVEKLDNITFNGGTTYALTKSSAAFTPVGANNILISIDGVINQSNFSVSGSNIVFDWSPTSSNTCNFILHYGTGVLNVPADGSVSLAKMASNSVDSNQYVDGSIDAVHLSANSVDSDAYVDASIDNAHLADDAVGVAELSATGTASSSTFLRGDNAWASAGGNAPAFSVRDTTQQSITDNSDTKVTWNTELYDSDSAFASDKFTVPSGQGGYYYLYAIACLDSQGSSNLNIAYLNIFVNGSRVTMSENDFRTNPLRKYNATVTTIQSLSATDYVEVYAKIDTSDAGAGLVTGDDYQQMFGGFKIG